jgi:signal transduction histidine kinase
MRRRSIVLAVFGVAPVVPALVLLYSADGLGAALRNSEQVTYALALTGAAFAYFHWRMNGTTLDRPATSRAAGWLTVGLLIVALQGLAQAAFVNPVPVPWRDAWPLISELVLVAILIGIVLVSERVEVPADPAVVGSVGAIVLTAAGFLTVNFVPALHLAPMTARLMVTALMVVGLLFAWAITQHRTASRWARRRLAAATVLLTFAVCIGNLATHNRLGVGLAVFANVAGAVVICTMSQALLRRSLMQHHREMLQLQETLAQARADVLHERELLHEVGSTVAGISSASQVIKQGPQLSGEHRARLEQMMNAEMARLERLMRSRTASFHDDLELTTSLDEHPAVDVDEDLDVDVDEVVEQLVLSHQNRGLDVRWEPSGLRALGDPDELSEVVNILLENARRHGGHTVWLDASQCGDYVELACSDDGPGVADEIRPQLFNSGFRGPDSPGQGLGLSIAQRHLSQRGGSLELGPSVHLGATFVARLKSSELADAHHVA